MMDVDSKGKGVEHIDGVPNLSSRILTRLQMHLFNLAGHPRKEHLLGQPVSLWMGHFGKEGNVNYRLYSKAPGPISITAFFFLNGRQFKICRRLHYTILSVEDQVSSSVSASSILADSESNIQC